MDEEEGEIKTETYFKVIEIFGGRRMMVFIVLSALLNHYIGHYVRILKSEWAQVKPE